MPENPDSFSNPFDTSIPDPFNSEQLIEDPVHGPSAVHSLLEIPEMPLGDGRYYQPGLGSFSPNHFDANGMPLDRVIGRATNTSASTRDTLLWLEWVDAYRRGGALTLTILEAQRQRQRMGKTGVALSFKPTDVCGGGKRLDECETAGQMVREARKIAGNTNQASNAHEGRVWNVPSRLSRRCGTCALSCQVAYETDNGASTGITRFATAQPPES